MNFSYCKQLFIGQSVLEATENKIPNSSPDDEIISCCMQIASKGNQPVSICFYKI